MTPLCDCSCAHPCPLHKAGMANRCTWEEVAGALRCSPAEAPARLQEWQAAKLLDKAEEAIRESLD